MSISTDPRRTIQEDLAAATAAYTARLEASAQRVKMEVIRPFCDRWNVSFCAGMGVWGFYAPPTSRRGPCEPIEPSMFMPRGQDMLPSDRKWLNHDLPDAFWREFANMHETLEGFCNAAADHQYIAAYLGEYTPAKE